MAERNGAWLVTGMPGSEPCTFEEFMRRALAGTVALSFGAGPVGVMPAVRRGSR